MNSNRNYFLSFFAGVLFTIVSIGGFWAVVTLTGIEDGGSRQNEPVLEGDSITSQQVIDKIDLLASYLEQYYLEDVDKEALVNGIYEGVARGVDDVYTTYYTKDQYDQVMESGSGVYSGIGVVLTQDPETSIIRVVRPFKDSPGEEAGILPGDVIVKVNGEEVSDQELTNVVAKIKGEEGTKVTLTLARSGVNEYFDLEVTRKTVETPTVEYEMLEDKIGYILVSEFDTITLSQYMEAIDKLEQQGMKGLVVDLRDNPGGYLDVVINMLDRMLPEGKIVYTEDKYGKGDTYRSDEENQFNKPLTVLINGNSASASEIFAGAIKDYKLGKLVGTQTFGKGIVQKIFDLEDGSALKITISKYFTPKGNNIHGVGIAPDVVVEPDKAMSQQVEQTKDKDNQLQKAIEVLKEEIK